jgi:CheY-like chemotaxis protein
VTRLLVVEDDDDVLEAYIDVLGDEGHEVVTARNGQEALDRLRSGLLPQIILLDLMMPVMDGFEFRAQQLADPAIAGVPVVVLTAGAVTDRVRELHPLACLTKPFDLEELLRLTASYDPGS